MNMNLLTGQSQRADCCLGWTLDLLLYCTIHHVLCACVGTTGRRANVGPVDTHYHVVMCACTCTCVRVLLMNDLEMSKLAKPFYELINNLSLGFYHCTPHLLWKGTIIWLARLASKGRILTRPLLFSLAFGDRATVNFETPKQLQSCGASAGPRKYFAWPTVIFAGIPAHSRVFCGGPRHALVKPRELPAGLWNYLWPVL